MNYVVGVVVFLLALIISVKGWDYLVPEAKQLRKTRTPTARNIALFIVVVCAFFLAAFAVSMVFPRVNGILVPLLLVGIFLLRYFTHSRITHWLYPKRDFGGEALRYTSWQNVSKLQKVSIISIILIITVLIILLIKNPGLY